MCTLMHYTQNIIPQSLFRKYFKIYIHYWSFFKLSIPLSCTISIFQTNITLAFINSLAVCIKIAEIRVQIQYAGGKSIMIIKSIKAFLGQNQERETASQESGMTPQRAAHLVWSSPARTIKKPKKNTVHLKRDKWQDCKEQTTFLSNTVYDATRNSFSIQSTLCQAQNMIPAL